MTMFRRSPTRRQWMMIVLMGIALAALIGWGVVELGGVFSEAKEDTHSEWVWDLPLWSILLLSAVQIVVGILAVASTWHYLEGWARRRRTERRLRDV